jgi:hypothetical protein
MTDTVTATGYLVIAAVRSRYGQQEVREAKPRRITQKRPQLYTDEIAVKISVRVPSAAFGPFRAEAVIDVPAELIAENNVQVTAQEPDRITEGDYVGG